MSAFGHRKEEPEGLPTVIRVDADAGIGLVRSNSSSSIKSSNNGNSSNSLTAHTNAIAKKAGLVFLIIIFLRQWALVLAIAPNLAPRTGSGVGSITEATRGSRAGPGSGAEECDGDCDGSPAIAGGGREEMERPRPPRIVTVLTTYGKRSAFVKPYKEAVSDRDDGYRPEVFLVSNEEDDDPGGIVDYKSGSWRQHRLLAAIAEACSRYEGAFDWLAIGDDDTAFLYNRAMTFLGQIDHTQPLSIGVVDGLNAFAAPCPRRKCFSPQQKLNASDPMAANGCCNDFTRRCVVPPFPERPTLEVGLNYTYSDYGPGGLFWPYGGSGSFISVGLAMGVVGGAEGWAECSRLFSNMNTDVQVAACLKLHGYSVGSYSQGFVQMATADPAEIRETLANDCQILGVHLGIRHLADGSDYSPEAFEAALAAVRDEDMAPSATGEKEEDEEEEEEEMVVVRRSSCPESLATLRVFQS